MNRLLLAYALVSLTTSGGLAASCPTGSDMLSGIVVRTEDGKGTSTIRRLDDATTEEKRVTLVNGIETRLTRVSLGGLIRISDTKNGVLQVMEYTPESSLPPIPLQFGVYRLAGRLTNEQPNKFQFLIDVRNETETIRIGKCEYPTLVIRYAEFVFTSDSDGKALVSPVFAKVYYSTDLGYPLRIGIFKAMNLDRLIGVDAYQSIEKVSASSLNPAE